MAINGTGRICVFAGSSVGARPEYQQAAHRLGEVLVDRGYGIVYGGGKIGLMGALADAALRRGGHVIGVIPEALVRKEVAHDGLSDLRVVESMHERKALMAALADGFIALPGGFGTFEEFFEILTWAQLGIHDKPVGLLNVGGYYDFMIQFLEHAVEQWFVRPAHAAMVTIESDAHGLVDRLQAYRAPDVEKWLDREET